MLKTNVDRLMELLGKHKEIAVKDAAMQLRTSIKQIEKLSKFLEEEGVVEVDYKFAKAYLKLLKELKPKDFSINQTKPSAEIKDRVIMKKVEKEHEKHSLLMSALDRLISMILLENLSKNDLKQILAEYFEIAEEIKKIKADNELINKGCRFTELYSYKKFTMQSKDYKSRPSDKNRQRIFKEFHDFSSNIESLEEQYGYKADDNLINDVRRLINQI